MPYDLLGALPVVAAGPAADHGTVMRTLTLSTVIFSFLLALTACGGPEAPPEEALDSAEENVEQASEGIDAMQEDVQALQSESSDLREQLDATVRKQVHLWQQQIRTYRERLTALPAEAERRLGPELDSLQQEVTALEKQLDAYTSAAAEAAPRLREDIDRAVENLRSRFEQLETSIAQS